MVTVYYQLCPKCNGDGHLGRYNSPALSTSLTPPCDVCFGAKTLFVNTAEPSRAMIAAMAMQGYCANEKYNEFKVGTLASFAVSQADALLAELSKKEETQNKDSVNL